MKRFFLVAASLATSVAFAQAPAPAATVTDAPKPKCEDPGMYPGRVGMQTEERRNKFLKGVDTYRTCMLNYVEERKATIKVNEKAAHSAIEEFNARMKRLNEEQEKARE